MRIFANSSELAIYAAELTAQAAAEAIEVRGAFHLALAGGNTPQACYARLREMEVAWSQVHIWFGDERCLPVDHPERNDYMARKALLMHVPVPVDQIHCIPAELGPAAAARSYADLLQGVVMDMLHLGMGEDGHTASLFPGHATLADSRLALAEFHSPKPPPERVSMGLVAINAARKKLILVAGSGKQDALKLIKAGRRLPVTMVENALWLVDREAAGD